MFCLFCLACLIMWCSPALLLMPNDVAETFVPGTVRDRLQSMLIPNIIGSQRICATAVCQLASILPCLSEGIGHGQQAAELL
ncbi:uncharacterized protein P174DRAFT_442797 [Aspergillus novofumigatus IBT 16806]|uniref:Uncharacterized protein n=1 Tax=Aspergillus novofumigatus (strain IBT 16806) TaxID=1392255 RepID=A0A2I1C5H9_ASPN1|nr:uncharacterized protein P174DRAFT_442797 [Aspergillus novofumigatus IBT 16806]PKX92930.1 hypothetical protein P174DRAFT_442797 [Aspergillus novofumigatus IBT 16806]